MTTRSKLEDSLAAQLDLAGRDANARWPYPAPVRELHFDWCCEHDRRKHRYGECDGCAQPWMDETSTGTVNGKPLTMGISIRYYDARSCHDYRHDRAWRFDFCWPALKVAVECDGGTRSGGRHVRPDGFAKDAEKLNAAALQGWLVLRFTQREITSGQALHDIERALKQASAAVLVEAAP